MTEPMTAEQEATLREFAALNDSTRVTMTATEAGGIVAALDAARAGVHLADEGLRAADRVLLRAADRVLAVPHREDDQPCGCDDCMSYGAEDWGADWYRLSPARRIALRVLDSGDDRLAPLVTTIREHEKAIAEPSPLEFPDHTHRWEERSQEALDWEYHETGAQLARWYCPGCHEETDVEPDSLIAAGVHLGDEGLDVERLARAMKESAGVVWRASWLAKPENFDWVARQVAAEYIRLSEGDSR